MAASRTPVDAAPVDAARALKEAGNRQLANGQPEWLVKAVGSYESGLIALGETAGGGGGAKALQWELRLNIALVRRYQSAAVGYCARSLPVISDLRPFSQAAVQLEDWSRAVSETSQLLLRVSEPTTVNRPYTFLLLICRLLTLSPCLQPPTEELAGPDQTKWRSLLTKARYRRGLAHCGTAATATKQAKRLLAGGEQVAGAAASAEAAAEAAQRAEAAAELGAADLEEAAKTVAGGGGKAMGKAERSRQSAIQTSLREAHEGLAQARAEGRRARRAVGAAAKPAKKYSADYGRFDAAAAELEGEVDSDDEREAVGKGKAAERRMGELKELAAKIEAMDDDAMLENGGLDKALGMVRRGHLTVPLPCHCRAIAP